MGTLSWSIKSCGPWLYSLWRRWACLTDELWLNCSAKWICGRKESWFLWEMQMGTDRERTWRNSLQSCCCCSTAKSCPILRNPKDGSVPDFPAPHHLPEFAQVHAHWVSDAIQSSDPLSPSFPSAFNLSQHQGLFQWVGSLHQVVKVLEPQLQHQSFQWIFRTDFL